MGDLLDRNPRSLLVVAVVGSFALLLALRFRGTNSTGQAVLPAAGEEVSDARSPADEPASRAPVESPAPFPSAEAAPSDGGPLAAEGTETAQERPANWIRVTELPAELVAAREAAQVDLKRRLQQLADQSTRAELEEWRDEVHAEFDEVRDFLLQDRKKQGFGDRYRVEVDEDGDSIPPNTTEMPAGHGGLIKLWTRTDDPHMVRVISIPYEQYPDVYELFWTATFLDDLLRR